MLLISKFPLVYHDTFVKVVRYQLLFGGYKNLMSIMKTRSFWIAAIMTLICSVAGVLLAKLPYVNLIGALVIALLLGIAMQLTPASVCVMRLKAASDLFLTNFYGLVLFFLVSA